MTTTTPPAYTIEYSREDNDYTLFVWGEYAGSFRSHSEAEKAARFQVEHYVAPHSEPATCALEAEAPMTVEQMETCERIAQRVRERMLTPQRCDCCKQDRIGCITVEGITNCPQCVEQAQAEAEDAWRGWVQHIQVNNLRLSNG